MTTLYTLHKDTHRKKSHKASVPGKLYIAGEYAVLTQGYGAIIVAVDAYLTCKVQLNEHLQSGTLTSDLNNRTSYHYQRHQVDLWQLNTENAQWRYVFSAIQIVEQFVTELHLPLLNFDLTIQSQLVHESGKKYGFGSSGAVTVAVIRALLGLYNIHPTPLLCYKLAVLCHLQLGSQGSFGDIAANCFGGWLYYCAPNKEWLNQQFTNQTLLPLLEDEWPLLHIEALTPPTDLQLVIGWTQTTASTDHHITQLQKSEHSRIQQQFLTTSEQAVQQIRLACQHNKIDALLDGIRENREVLKKLSHALNLAIETETLTQLIDDAHHCGFVAKSSGAGGGDCGIALGNIKSSNIHQLHQQWRQHHITPLSYNISQSITTNSR